MSNIDYILTLCFEISDQGKRPTVALVRNMSKHPLGIPEVVKALQHWKSNPKSRPPSSVAIPPSNVLPEPSLEQRVTELEAKVAQMDQLLAELSVSQTK